MIEALGRIAAGPNSAGKVIAGLGGVVRTGRPDIQSGCSRCPGWFRSGRRIGRPRPDPSHRGGRTRETLPRYVAGFRGVGPDRTEHEVGR